MDTGGFLVVGIGASAGGIQAIKQFFEHVPQDTGIAYVVVLHLSPDHESRLAEVLQSSAKIPVTQVPDRVRVQPNHVYVIPPDKSLAIQEGHLLLSEITSFEQRRAPVDIFFRTLAESHGTRAVCVVLSGTGANGSSGLKRVKERGGIAIVQDPGEAEHAEMPRNSIATALVDYVLPVAAIPAKILAYQASLGAVQLPEHPAETLQGAVSDESALREVFSILRTRTAHDFSSYKRATVLRRIGRRMGLNGLISLPEYARFLRGHGEETKAILKDLLISVTSFFRDREAFETLERLVIPRLFEGKGEDDAVRVWVAGCATGEEAYSIAMLLAERCGSAPGSPAVQIFASDIDEDAIAVAREGAYTFNDAADVGPERLGRFFLREGGRYVVRKELRETVLFAHHNLLKDPPFSHLDLATCRNLLIYLNRSAQQRVLSLLHFALNPGGYLFLGTSESTEGSGDQFVTVDKEAHIFQSRAIATRLQVPVPEVPAGGRTAANAADERKVERQARERLSAADLHQRLLEQYAPPSIVVNEEHEIVHLTEQAGQYLQYRGGEPTHNLVRIVRPELRLEMRTALYQALQQQTNVRTPVIPVRLRERLANVSIEIRPVLREDDPARGYFLVMFQEAPDGAAPAPAPAPATVEAGDAARQLEEELIRVRGQLRATVERHETQAEELKASNEELQAMNEELRSSTEELETSKEELQSLNEELRTVNQELKIKIDEQTQANDDIQNLINSTEIGTIFLDRLSRIKLFTPRARDLFTLLPADRGRPLSDISTALVDVDLQTEARRVLERLERSEREVRTKDDRWHLMRVLPYRTADDRIDGVVLTFVDITERKRVEEALRASEERLRRAFAIETIGIIFFRTDGRITDANDAFLRLSGYERDDIDRGRVRWDAIMPDDFMRRLEAFRPETDALGSTPPFEQEYVRKDGSRWWGLLALTGLGGAEAAAFVVNVTTIKEAEGLTATNRALDAELRQRRLAEAQIRGLMRRLITAQEDERRLVARDLHDHLGQQVAGLALKLDAVKEMARGHAALESAVDDARSTIVKLDRDLDFFVWEMRGADGNEQGLAASLSTFVREWSRNFGIAAEFHSRGFDGERLSKEIEINLYRITQEALTNVYKHARAERVDVLLERRDSSAVLVIEDDGVGFERAATLERRSDGGVGIVGMEERAGLMGGTLEIETAPGKGTSLFVRVPIAPVEPSS
jgi:two-component system CheB/CheR fusion protein